MKVLSVMQPWASAIIYGGKDVENRRWRTQYRGRFGVHASNSVDWLAPDHAWLAAGLTPPPEIGTFVKKHWTATLPMGVILGDVDLTDIVVGSSSRWAARGQWNWLLAEPVAYPVPVPARGDRGLWPWAGSRAAMRQLAHVPIASPWLRVDDEHPRWELPGERDGAGILTEAGHLVTDELIRTYGRNYVEKLIGDLPPLPDEAWKVDKR